MNLDSGRPADVDLDRQRRTIRIGLSRANTAAVLVILVVLLLAIASIFAARQAAQQRIRAEKAERDATEKLWRS
jgi:hypothetical protein